MSKILKKANDLRKKSWTSTKKIFRKVASTTIGKVVLVAAAIWLGGAALGAWNSGIAAVDGAFVGGAAGAGGAATTTGAASTIGTTGAAASNAAAAASIPAGIETLTVTAAPTAGMGAVGNTIAAGGAAAAAAPSAASTVTAAPTQLPASTAPVTPDTTALDTLATNSSSKGLISKLMDPVSKMATWAGDNPIPALIAAKGVGAMLTPDPVEAQLEAEEETRKRWEENMAVGNINLGFAPNQNPLTYTDGTPVYGARGAINRQTRRA